MCFHEPFQGHAILLSCHGYEAHAYMAIPFMLRGPAGDLGNHLFAIGFRVSCSSGSDVAAEG